MSSFPTGRRFPFPQINEEGRRLLILSEKLEAKHYAGAGGRGEEKDMAPKYEEEEKRRQRVLHQRERDIEF